MKKNAVVLSVALGALAIFLLLAIKGDRGVVGGFRFRVRFENAGGLEPGSFVLLSGLRVGEVESIRIVEDGGRPQVEAAVLVDESARPYLREDTAARVGTLGLLGEKHLALSFGSGDSPPLEPGGAITGEPPMDISATLKRLESTVSNLEEVTRTMAEVNRNLKDAIVKVKEEWVRFAGAMREGAEGLKFWKWFGKGGGGEPEE